MRKSAKWLAILCLIAMLLQACGGASNSTGNDAPDNNKPGTGTGEGSDAPEGSETPEGSEKPEGSQKPDVPAKSKVTLTEAEMKDKITGGWIGQMVGVAWAASTEFTHAGKLIPETGMPIWKPEMINDAFGQDDLYVEIPFLDAMKDHGVDCDPKYMAETFRDSKFALWHANYMGRQNLLNGIPFPQSGSYLYNYHADDIDWQIEADFLGMMYPGMPNEAAKRAFEIGHIMNYGDGVYGGVFVTAMHSAAYTATSIEEIWRAGVEVIPEGTEFRNLLDDVIESYKAGDTFEQNWRKLEVKWASKDLCPELPGKSNIDAKLNSGYILLGMLYGEGDINKTIILSTRCGQDSDCNPSSAASILGNYYGASKLPKNYASALDYINTNFSFTEYNFRETIDLNMDLMREVLEKSGAVKNDNKSWTFEKDNLYIPVEFEQWPDGVFGYLELKVTGSSVKIVELTPYAKNEKIVGYVLDMGDGYKFNNVTPASYTYAKKGVYTITLTVTGDKGTEMKVEREVKIATDGSASLLSKPIIICYVTTPWGGGSRDINIICDGKAPTSQGSQYDTYVLGDPHGNPAGCKTAYVGYIYREEKTVSKVVFTEGMSFGNGGWFTTLEVQVLVNGEWKAVEYTMDGDEYPLKNNGKNYDTYTFVLNTPTKCDGVRLCGKAGGSQTFISIGELTVN
ncbi:MAG: hypothetical protein E7599_01335 [Ruminococcaceae bacterium]|nr:hypothetical protein [Oscillospiraceae bacterium]